jgi:hypothetical protein
MFMWHGAIIISAGKPIPAVGGTMQIDSTKVFWQADIQPIVDRISFFKWALRWLQNLFHF